MIFFVTSQLRHSDVIIIPYDSRLSSHHGSVCVILIHLVDHVDHGLVCNWYFGLVACFMVLVCVSHKCFQL